MPIKQEVCDEDEDEGEDGEKSSGVPVSAADGAAMQWPGAHKVTNMTTYISFHTSTDTDLNRYAWMVEGMNKSYWRELD